jgi:hypothetical protein
MHCGSSCVGSGFNERNDGMKEPVDHILRPRLPWRSDEGAITECGYDALKVKTLTREEYFRRHKDLGSQRCAMLTCMTCSQTAGRWKAWDQDPREALEREIVWEHGWNSRVDRGERLKDELSAIADLIETHRDEFDAFITNRRQRRDWLEKKAEAARRPKPPSPRGL